METEISELDMMNAQYVGNIDLFCFLTSGRQLHRIYAEVEEITRAFLNLLIPYYKSVSTTINKNFIILIIDKKLTNCTKV